MRRVFLMPLRNLFSDILYKGIHMDTPLNCLDLSK